MTSTMGVWVPLFAVLLTLSGTWAYPSGAPRYSCGIYVPNHHSYPQSPRTVPFSVVASSHTYNLKYGGGLTEVNITNNAGSTKFKGFVLAAYDEYGQPFGAFLDSSLAHQIHGCDRPAMTHNNSHNKELVTLYWKPPQKDAPHTGIVNFRATVVGSYHRFWVDIPSTVRGAHPAVDHQN